MNIKQFTAYSIALLTVAACSFVEARQSEGMPKLDRSITAVHMRQDYTPVNTKAGVLFVIVDKVTACGRPARGATIKGCIIKLPGGTGLISILREAPLKMDGTADHECRHFAWGGRHTNWGRNQVRDTTASDDSVKFEMWTRCMATWSDTNKT
jgi:hypothetical protein